RGPRQSPTEAAAWTPMRLPAQRRPPRCAAGPARRADRGVRERRGTLDRSPEPRRARGWRRPYRRCSGMFEPRPGAPEELASVPARPRPAELQDEFLTQPRAGWAG